MLLMPTCLPGHTLSWRVRCLGDSRAIKERGTLGAHRQVHTLDLPFTSWVNLAESISVSGTCFLICEIGTQYLPCEAVVRNNRNRQHENAQDKGMLSQRHFLPLPCYRSSHVRRRQAGCLHLEWGPFFKRWPWWSVGAVLLLLPIEHEAQLYLRQDHSLLVFNLKEHWCIEVPFVFIVLMWVCL